MPKKEKKEAKNAGRNKIAYILLFIAVLFLYVNSIFTVMAKKQIAAIIEQVYGIPMLDVALLTYALIWLILGTMAWITNYKINKTGSRSQKWMLFIISIATMITGRIEAGIVMMVSSILYLRIK